MENVIFIENACFYVKDGQVAVSFADTAVLAERTVYDGKNTLALYGIDGKIYVVQNIVPDVREILKKSQNIMVVLEQGGKIAGAYEVFLLINDSLDFEDNFNQEAKGFFADMLKLAETE